MWQQSDRTFGELPLIYVGGTPHTPAPGRPATRLAAAACAARRAAPASQHPRRRICMLTSVHSSQQLHHLNTAPAPSSCCCSSLGSVSQNVVFLSCRQTCATGRCLECCGATLPALQTAHCASMAMVAAPVPCLTGIPAEGAMSLFACRRLFLSMMTMSLAFTIQERLELRWTLRPGEKHALLGLVIAIGINMWADL